MSESKVLANFHCHCLMIEKKEISSNRYGYRKGVSCDASAPLIENLADRVAGVASIDCYWKLIRWVRGNA